MFETPTSSAFMTSTTATFASIPRRGARRQAFSLIEVVLAIGVIAFAFIPMFGLLPVGLTTFRQSIENTVGSQIAQQLINQAQETDFTTLTLTANQETGNYFDEQGNLLSSVNGSASANPAPAGTVYTAEVTVTPQTSLPNAIAAVSTNLATVSVRIAHNPANTPMTGPNAVSSTVYSAHIARNL